MLDYREGAITFLLNAETFLVFYRIVCASKMFTKLLVVLLFVASQSEASSQNAGERGSQFDAFAFGIVIGILLSMLWQNDFDVNAIIEKITRKDDSAAKKQPDSSRKVCFFNNHHHYYRITTTYTLCSER